MHSLPTYDDTSRETRRLADLCRAIAVSELRDGRPEHAERWGRRSLELHSEELGDDHFETLIDRVVLAEILIAPQGGPAVGRLVAAS